MLMSFYTRYIVLLAMGPRHEATEAVAIYSRQEDVTDRSTHYGNGCRTYDCACDNRGVQELYHQWHGWFLFLGAIKHCIIYYGVILWD